MTFNHCWFKCLRYSILIVLIVFAASAAARASDGAARPQRIVSLGPGITKKLYLLGAGEKIVANTTYCISPEAARHKEKIGNVTQVNVEKVLSLKPDLVVAIGLTRPRQVEKIRSLGVRIVRFVRPDSFSMMNRDFIELGALTGYEEKAREIVKQTEIAVALIRERIKGLPRKRVFIQIGVKPLFTATKDSFLNDYIEFSGGENIAKTQSTGIYSREKVIKGDPEFIFITTMGTSAGNKESEKATWMNYPTIRAVKDNNIYMLDSNDVCSPTPVVFIEMLERIVKILHPEVE